jgi:FkbM family methyltransferase
MKKIIQNMLKSTGYRIEKIRPAPPGPELIVFDFVAQFVMSKSGENLTFIEIGANDGQLEDPLYPWVKRFPWRGIFVEPQPHLCRKLRALWNDRADISVIQAAIGTHAGKTTLWCVKDISGDTNFSGLASLDRDTLLKHRYRIPDIESRIEAIEVDVITIVELMERAGFESLDILQVDAEGFDFEIIKMLDFTKTKPKIINYEHCNLSWDDQTACRNLLRDQGYGFATYHGDTVAVRLDFLPAALDRSVCHI